MFAGFQTAEIDTGDTTIFARWAGSGPAILLLHGFPESLRAGELKLFCDMDQRQAIDDQVLELLQRWSRRQPPFDRVIVSAGDHERNE